MQKRGLSIKLSLLGLVTALLLPSVAAQGPLSSVGDMLRSILKPVLFSFESGNFLFWARVLMWVLVFALLYSITGLIPTIGDRRNVRLTVSAILAFISVIPLSEPLLRALFQTYGIVVATVLIVAPIVGMFFITKKLTGILEPSSPRLAHGISAVVFYILAAIIQNVVNATDTTGVFGTKGLNEVGAFAISICALMFLYHFVMMIFTGMSDKVSDRAGRGWNWVTDKMTPEEKIETPPGETPPDYPGELVAHIDELCARIRAFSNFIMHNRDDGLRTIGNALLKAEQSAFEEGNQAVYDTLEGLRTNYLQAADQARSWRLNIEGSVNRLIDDPNFNRLNRRHQRRFQQCMRLWTSAYSHYQQYSVRFIQHQTEVRGPVKL